MDRRRGQRCKEGCERMKWAETEGRRIKVDGTRSRKRGGR